MKGDRERGVEKEVEEIKWRFVFTLFFTSRQDRKIAKMLLNLEVLEH